MLESVVNMPDATARDVVAHLCGEPCHGYGQTAEVCESRGDCVIIVTCDCCGKQFTLDDDQYDLLVAWTQKDGTALACGIEPLPA